MKNQCFLKLLLAFYIGMCYNIGIPIKEVFHLGIIKNKDKRSGITYVYESKSYWDKDKNQSRSKRTLIGRLDEVTGEIIPTDGRCKKLSPTFVPSEDDYQMPKSMKEMRAEIIRLLEENSSLKKQLQSKS